MTAKKAPPPPLTIEQAMHALDCALNAQQEFAKFVAAIKPYLLNPQWNRLAKIGNSLFGIHYRLEGIWYGHRERTGTFVDFEREFHKRVHPAFTTTYELEKGRRK